MNTFKHWARAATTVALAGLLALAGCGGGGGSAGSAPFGSGSGTGGGTGNPVTPATTSVAVSLSTTTVTAAVPATVTARVTNSAGDPLPGQVVKFSTSANLGAFSSGTALTNDQGVATVTLSPANSTSVGADAVVASVTVNGTAVTGSTGFQLTATNVTISSFTSDLGAAALGAYGQTQLAVALAGTSPSSPVNVSISSACVQQGRATLTPSAISTSTGSAVFTYRDDGCGAFNTTDGLQVSVNGTGATASQTLRLTAPAVASVAFVSASPREIYLRGSGFVENSNITFQVRDANGLGVPNQLVTLEATSLAGGLQIDDGSVPVSKRTDSNGNVLVRINAGTVPTPVRVRATLAGSNISTVSSTLAIAVGLPSQQNFSLSQLTHNIEGYDRDGTTNSYTLIASDRLGNPVPEGTAINFVTEAGQVQAIRFTTLTNGLSGATANFQTSSPRPLDGRVTVLAYALGEESFLDTNGDNVYSPGEDYQDLGDIFLDRLFNRSYNAAEDQFISPGLTGNQPCRSAASSLLALGTNAPSRSLSTTGAALNTCISGWGQAYVRKAIQTVFSTSSGRLGWRGLPGDARVASVAPGSCSRVQLIDQISAAPYALDDSAARVSFYLLGDYANVVLHSLGKTGSIGFLLADNNPVALNPAAAGTVVTATGTEGLSATVLGGTVPSSLDPTSLSVNYNFADETQTGTITFNIRSPSGLITTFTQRVARNAEPTASPCQ